MKTISKIIIRSTIGLMMIFCLFTITYAIDDYTVLAPLPGTTNGATTNFSTYLPGVFNLSIGIAAVLAFVMITFGGIMYATSDAISGKAQGREYVTNAIWGLLLVIGAYVILYTINPQILSFNLSIGQPNVKAGEASVVAGTPMTQASIDASNAVKATLSQAGVATYAGPCAAGQTTGCVNLNGLPQSAVLGLTGLKSSCNCDVTITGGTEGGHQTHGVGRPMVDLTPSSSLNSFLGVTPREGTQVVKTFPNGRRGVFTYETTGGNANGTSTGNHWHVSFE